MTPLDIAELIHAQRRLDAIGERATRAVRDREVQLVALLATTAARQPGDVQAKLGVLEELVATGDHPAHQLALLMSARADLAAIFGSAHVDPREARGCHHGTTE